MKHFFLTVAAAVLVASFGSCTGRKVYDHYVNTPINGWEKNDTLTYCIPRIAIPGRYRADLGLRINSEYPFMGLTLIVEQTVYPSKKTQTETIACDLIDKKGNSKGIGLSYYQYSFPINTLNLSMGDSLVVRIRHDMKREILPGISNVGVKLTAY